MPVWARLAVSHERRHCISDDRSERADGPLLGGRAGRRRYPGAGAARRSGAGGWGSVATFAHDLYVRKDDLARACEVVAEDVDTEI